MIEDSPAKRLCRKSLAQGDRLVYRVLSPHRPLVVSVSKHKQYCDTATKAERQLVPTGRDLSLQKPFAHSLISETQDGSDWLEFDYSSAPGKASAEGIEQNDIAFFDPALTPRFIESDGH